MEAVPVRLKQMHGILMVCFETVFICWHW